MKDELFYILDTTLQGFYYTVEDQKNCFNEPFISIHIATSNYEIHNVRGQFYNHISMKLTPKFELSFQAFCGQGGQSIYRSVDKSNPNESWLALKSEKIPFRTPKPNSEAVLKAFQKVCERYIEKLIEINDRGLLRSENLAHTQSLLAPDMKRK